MILRMVRGRLAPAKLDEARAVLAGAGLLPGTPRPGLVGSHLGAREDGDELEVLSLDFWTTPEAAHAEAPDGPADTDALLRTLLEGAESAHFEVDDMLLRATTRPVVAIRLTIGRFSRPGADIEMQDLLRQRVPTIGDEMTESYVARRIVGTAVEVVFITTWTSEPEHPPLDEPLWPDIALRYDTFFLAIYAPIDRAPRRAG